MNKLDKSEGVKDCFKFIEKRLKELKKEKDKIADYYDYDLCRYEGAIRELVKIKISLEKYCKKLKHEYKEDN